MAGAVHHGQPRVHQHLSEQLDVALMFAPQSTALFPLQNLDRLLRSSQQHWWQRCGEDETSCIRTHSVDQSSSARDVAPHAAEGLACRMA